ncbi:MAG: hypothetical protein AAFX99_03945 [Myxococcota bacterium]
MLLGFAVLGRFVAWLAHGAVFAYDMLAVEGVVIVFLLVASSRQAEQEG